MSATIGPVERALVRLAAWAVSVAERIYAFSTVPGQNRTGGKR